jgi:hypothetical protein
MTIFAPRQQSLFATVKPKPTPPIIGNALPGTPPAPPKSTGWLKSLLCAHQCPPDQPPAIRHRRSA